MNILIIIGHPHTNSFNHAIADICKTQILQNGHSFIFHDLYKERFNPLNEEMDALFPELPEEENIANHCSDLLNCDGIIIIHPNWWGQPPAIMKGWLDRVWLPEIAYTFIINDKGETVPKGLLKAKIGIVFNTSNTCEDLENDLYKDPLETIWKNRIFNFCGVKQFERRNFNVIKDSNLQQRLNWLNDVKLLINTHFPE